MHAKVECGKIQRHLDSQIQRRKREIVCLTSIIEVRPETMKKVRDRVLDFEVDNQLHARITRTQDDKEEK